MIGIFINLWNRLTGGGTPAPTPALLDEYGGAAAAFSLRKLSSTYGGSAVRVRRSLDNTEQDIGFSGDNLDETALQTFVGYENLLQRSEQFENAFWTKTGTNISANSTLAPNGSLTADTLIEDTLINYHGVFLASVLNVTAGQTYTFSVYAKQASGTRFLGISPVDAGGSGNTYAAVFDLVNGVFLGNAFTNPSPVGTPFTSANTSIQSVGNGWYRISATTTVTGTQYYCTSYLFNSFSNNTINGRTYTGDGTSGVFLWGAQLNQGVTAQPYQVTTATANTANGFVTKWYTQDGNGENLFTYSEQFDNASWSKLGGAVTANAGTDPFGGNNADRWLNNAVPYALYQSIPLNVGQTYTISIYAKSNTGANQLFRLFALGATLSNDLVATTSWQRFSFTFVAVTSGSFNNGIVRPSTDAPNDLLIFGAQLSQSSWLQGYQATTTTAVSRRDASQATAASQPRIVNAGVIERENGKPAIYFTGSNTLIPQASNDIFRNVGYAGMYAVASVLGSASDKLIYLSTVSTSQIGRVTIGADATGFITGGRRLDANTFAFVSDNNYTSSKQLILSGLLNYATSDAYLYKLGLLVAQNTSFQTDGNTSDTSSLGSMIGSNTALNANWIGDIQELLLYNTNTTNNVLQINSNQNSYYQAFWQGTQQALLDQFGGSAAAFSLRNLSSSYRGPLVRVRRSSDNAETDIGGTFSGDLDVNSLLAFTGGQNLILQSEDFTQGVWTKEALTVSANATISPNGTLTASAINETATNGGHVIYQPIGAISANGPMTASVYLKAKERRYASVSITTAVGASIRNNVIVDLQDGIIVKSSIASSASGAYSSITSAGNGWWRVSVSLISTTTTLSTNYLVVGPSNSANPTTISTLDPTYLGVAGSGVYIWGAQLNTGILQPYIPTTTAAINGSNAFVTKWYDQSGIGDNLVLQSETFGNASWLKSFITVSDNTTTAPDNTITADTVFETTNNGGHSTYQSNAYSSGIYTYSLYLKYFNRKYVLLAITDIVANGAGIVLDLETASFIGNSSVGSGYSVLSYSITNAPNGWYRYSVTVSTSGIPSPNLLLRNTNSLVWANPYTGSDSVGVYVWGAQLSLGTELLRYQPTTTAIAPKRDAIQTTALNQPMLVSSGSVMSKYGKPTINFASQSLDISTFAVLNNEATLVGVYNSSATNTNISAGIINYRSNPVDNPELRFGIGDGNALADYYNGGYAIVNANIDSIIGGLYFYQRVAGYTSTIFKNALQLATGTRAGTLASGVTEFTIGRYNNVSGYRNGDVSELIAIPSNLSASRQTIESNLNTYYQIYWQGNGTALLDSFSGASAAYSLRNLSSAYTGPLIRVRRSSDNAERDIYGTFRGDLDLAALTSFVGANSGFVTTWYDQSGTGRHATQATAASQPRIVNAGAVETVNGKPAVFTNGTNMSFSTLTMSDFTLFWVSRKADGGPSGSVILSGPSVNYAADDSDNAGNPVVNSSGPVVRLILGNTSLSGLEINQHLSYANRRNGTQAVGQFNNSENAYNNSVTSDQLVLNAIANYPPIFAYSYNGHIQEILMYPDDRSSSRTGMSSNINNYYKIY